mmetsp:Transcript_14630/g.21536  ORF Transcript_14630/g.21536 Transcript_14630/m.21536 type:complete len:240 (+) Transcript_14630:785-1504(+)
MKDRCQRSNTRQPIKRLGSRNRHERNRSQHSHGRHLRVTILDTVQVEDRQRVGRNQTVQGQNLVHLHTRNQGTTTLPNNVDATSNTWHLACKRSCDTCIAKFDHGKLVGFHIVKLRSHGCGGPFDATANTLLLLGLLHFFRGKFFHGLEGRPRFTLGLKFCDPFHHASLLLGSIGLGFCLLLSLGLLLLGQGILLVVSLDGNLSRLDLIQLNQIILLHELRILVRITSKSTNLHLDNPW